MNIFSLSGLILAVITSGLIAILAFWGKLYLHRIWILFNIAVLIWGVCTYLIGKEVVPSQALILWRIAHVGIILIPVFLYHFVSTLCNIQKRKLLFFVYLQGLIFIIFTFFSFFLSGVRHVFSSFYYAVPNHAYHPFSALWMSIVIYSHYLLFLHYSYTDGVRRSQILYLFFGSFVGFSGGITYFLIGYGIDIY